VGLHNVGMTCGMFNGYLFTFCWSREPSTVCYALSLLSFLNKSYVEEWNLLDQCPPSNLMYMYLVDLLNGSNELSQVFSHQDRGWIPGSFKLGI
jgi:hypothetical protein